MAEDVKSIAENLKGKKAKIKKLEVKPEGTKELKLPKDVEKGLQEVFGAKLNKVRVHSGGNAADMCKEVGAKAFTYGTDIFVSKAGYAKDSTFLAHELTHVIQQGGGSKLPKPQNGKVLTTK